MKTDKYLEYFCRNETSCNSKRGKWFIKQFVYKNMSYHKTLDN